MSNRSNETMCMIRRIGVGAVLIAATFGASACSSPEMDRAEFWVEKQWTVDSNHYSPERLAMRVRRDEISSSVSFAPRSAALQYDQRIALFRFVANSGAGRGDRAQIAVSLDGGRALAERRVAAVASILHRRGISVSRAFAPGPSNLATVTLSRVVAIAPDCPEWERLLKDGTVNEYKPKLGCWNASSLAASVHNPRDLVSGRPVGPSDGPTLNRGLQLLREGKFDPRIEPEGTGTKFSTEK
jgi:pilus assembly protein CpaD